MLFVLCALKGQEHRDASQIHHLFTPLMSLKDDGTWKQDEMKKRDFTAFLAAQGSKTAQRERDGKRINDLKEHDNGKK